MKKKKANSPRSERQCEPHEKGGVMVRAVFVANAMATAAFAVNEGAVSRRRKPLRKG